MFKLQYLINYVFNYNFDSGGAVIRIAKSQGSVMRLTISRPISHSHELATDFSKESLELYGSFPS